MSELTYEKILAAMRSLPPAPHNDLADPFRFRPFGMKLYEAPPPPPRIQVRDIKFSDGTSILSPKFRAEVNAWLLERFGFADDMFKDKIYFLGNYAMIAKPEYCGIIRNLIA